ncbi:MAG: hypothetical protein J0M18_15465, partial [Ignavibacteria bacterium]|nr:hypothetical protein [Ignavibacteria bacterium]
MKKIIKISYLFALLILGSNVFAQNVEVSSGGPVISYATIKLAFAAINNGTFTGVITVNIVGNTTEVGISVLDSSGNGTGSNYTSITIQPSGGAPRTISGNISGGLIYLIGADNITINGLNTGSNSLTISNTATSTLSSAITFSADAKNNIITNCTLTGSATGNGVINFSIGSASGNDNNTISNNNITASGINLPLNCIYSSGSSLTIDNSENIISGNNISDFFSATAASSGITLPSNNSSWTITNNKIFQSAGRTYTSGSVHSGISINSGSGYTITGNTIGYATSGGTGTYTMLGTAATRFGGINIVAQATSAVSSIQGNTITAISLNTSSGTSTTSGVLCGINILGATNANVGNITPNIIGGSSGTGLLTAILTTTQGAVVGINSSSTGTVVIQNNIIGGLTSSGTTAAIAGSIYGINVSGSAFSMTITGNTVGNGTADNMRGGTTGLTTGSSLVTGINFPTQPSTSTITNNTIQNLTSYGTGTSGFARGIAILTGSLSPYPITGNTISNVYSNNGLTSLSNGAISVAGIILAGGQNSVISTNTIYNIGNTNTGTGGYVVSGIILANAVSTKVSNNIIYGVTNAGTSTTVTSPGVAAGISVRSGTTSDTISNNMITLGIGQTTNTAFIGIYLNNGATPNPVSNIFYNTVSISGTVTSGAQSSFAIARTDFSVTAKTAGVVIKNNVFDNSRTGGTGKHYAIANNYGTTASATGWIAETSDNNVLNSASPSTIGYWTTDQTLAGWIAASSCDASSESAIAITYTNASTGNLRFNMGVTATKLESRAISLTSVTTDIDGFARPKPGAVNGGALAPDFGASESDMVPIIPLPVELASFTSSVNNNNVTLNWSTVQEQNNKGFEIERNSFGAGWKKIGYAEGHGTTNQPNNYIFKENNLTTGRYNYRLKQIDYNGNFEYFELSNEVAIGVPNRYLLAQNYPNPFNPVSIINYQLAISSFVSL